MRFHYTEWIHEVCQNPELLELRERNARRLAAMKAANSLTEKHERASACEPSTAGLGNYYIGNPYLNPFNDRGDPFRNVAMVDGR